MEHAAFLAVAKRFRGRLPGCHTASEGQWVEAVQIGEVVIAMFTNKRYVIKAKFPRQLNGNRIEVRAVVEVSHQHEDHQADVSDTQRAVEEVAFEVSDAIQISLGDICRARHCLPEEVTMSEE